MPEGTHGGDRSTPQARLSTKQKEARALELRIGGASYQQIADAMGIKGGRSAAHKMVKRALDAIPAEGATELRQVELARMDELEMRLRARLRSGDVSVANALLRLSDQRAKLTGMYQSPEIGADMGQLAAVFAGLMASASAFAAEQGYLDQEPELGNGHQVLSISEAA